MTLSICSWRIVGVTFVILSLTACMDDPEAKPTTSVADVSTSQGETQENARGQLQRIVQDGRSNVINYPIGKPQQSFYMRLRSEALWNQTDTTCVDQSFSAWIRKWFHSDAASTALVASIQAPGEIEAKSVPLFEATVAESPNECTTRVVNRPITPYYLVNSGQGFGINVSMRWSETASVSGFRSLLDVSKTLLNFTGASANLIEIAGAQEINAAANKIDQSLAAHWSQSNQDSTEDQISPYPSIGVSLDKHTDTLSFQAAPIVSNWTGVEVSDQRIPAVRIIPEYLTSYFSTNGDDYIDSARILSRSLGISNSHSLRDMLRVGLVGGVSTVAARTLTTQSAMRQFCTDLRQTLSRFLTVNDELAARYAILALETAYLASDNLRDDQCLSATDLTALATMRDSFKVPALTRQQDFERTQFVETRMRPVTAALRNKDISSIDGLVADKDAFAITVMNPEVFPDNSDGWGGTGEEAIQQLQSLTIRSGCYQAPPGQNLTTISAIALLPNQKNSGLLATFNEDGKVARLVFADPEFIASLMNTPSWPSSSCSLL